jgi:hypothetical protein
MITLIGLIGAVIDFAAASAFYYFINGDMSLDNQLKFYFAHCLSAHLILLALMLNKNAQKALFSISVVMLEKLQKNIDQ